MKALVLEITGRKAILLLPGGEMRTVRSQRGWQTGMTVSVNPYPLPKRKKQTNPSAVLWPLTACAAAFLIVFAGFRMLTGVHIDRQYPIGPLASGQTAETSAPTDRPTAEPSPVPTPTVSPIPPLPAPEQTPAYASAAAVTPLPTPEKQAVRDHHHSNEICDECGQAGHDDDQCPDQICDECGRMGHDDDDCPEQICDECGKKGHDDDDCPYKQKGRGDD